MLAVQEELPYLKTLIASTRVEFQKFLLYSSKKRVTIVCEIIANILNKNIPSNDVEIKALSRHKRLLRKLCKTSQASKLRKKNLIRHSALIQETLKRYIDRIEDLLKQWIQSEEQ